MGNIVNEKVSNKTNDRLFSKVYILLLLLLLCGNMEKEECVKKYRTCYCVSCSEDRFEEANSRAMRMNVRDAEGHDFYDAFEEN